MNFDFASGQEVEWTNQFGTPDLKDLTNDVWVDSTGIYTAGFTELGSSNTLAFVAKYDVDGNEVWKKQFVIVSGSAIARDVAVDSTGVYVAGESGADGFIRKYDFDGNEIWTVQLGADHKINGVTVGSSGIYVAGSTHDLLPGDTTSNFNGFVRKYDTNGNEIWAKLFGTPEIDSVWSISADSSGIYVAGRTAGTFSGQVSNGIEDAFVIKYDVNGNEVWTRQFGTTALDSALGIYAHSSGIYATGTTFGTLAGQTRVGGNDGFLAKYDVDGNQVWVRQFGTTSGEVAIDVFADSSSVYAVGFTFGSFSGYTRQGGTDAYVVSYDTNGNELWAFQFGTSNYDRADGVSADSSAVYIGGGIDGASGFNVENVFAYVLKLIPPITENDIMAMYSFIYLAI